MTTYELNADQMEQLKQNYICQTQENVTWSDLAESTKLPDAVIHEYYSGMLFTEDDFT